VRGQRQKPIIDCPWKREKNYGKRSRQDREDLEQAQIHFYFFKQIYMTEEKNVTTEEIKETEVKSEALDVEKTADETEKKKTKKVKRQILKGRAVIKCTYNNTIVSIADINGNILGWASSGLLGFKGAKKATPYAATQVVGNVSEKVKKYGLRELEVYVKVWVAGEKLLSELCE